VLLALPVYDDNPAVRAPIVTIGLIGLCTIVFLFQLTQDDDAVDRIAQAYGMVPAVVLGAHVPRNSTTMAPWLTIITSMFLHSGWLHIGGNMLFLWIFGNNIEDVLGPVRFLLLYLLSGIAAALSQAFSDPTSVAPMIGASGAIAGVLGAYLLIYPRANVHVFLWIVIFVRMITIPAWIVLGVWFGLQLLSGLIADPDDAGVAFWAHVGGFAAGMILIVLLKPRGIALWQEPRTSAFVAVPPAQFRRSSTGSVPEAGERPPRDLWNDPWA
jgi:membrane associated rhomboid family serine protease